MEWDVSPTPVLYNSVKLCKPFGRFNIRGINETTKREEVVDVFKKGKFKLLALTEKKLKGKGEVSWYGVNGIIAGVQKMERARERMAILLNNM